VLLADHPLAVVLATISPLVNAVAVLLVIFIVSFVPSTVRPGVHARSVHVVVLPVSFKPSAVWPFVNTEAVDFVIAPSPTEARAVGPVIGSLTMLLSVNIVSFKVRAICPGFLAPSVLNIVFPKAQVASSISVLVKTIAISFVVHPVAFVGVPVSVPKSAFSVSCPIDPLTLVLASVGPYLSSPSLLDLIFINISSEHRVGPRAPQFLNHLQLLLLDPKLHLLIMFRRIDRVVGILQIDLNVQIYFFLNTILHLRRHSNGIV
jgi:hypothetical protein